MSVLNVVNVKLNFCSHSWNVCSKAWNRHSQPWNAYPQLWNKLTETNLQTFRVMRLAESSTNYPSDWG